MLLKVYEENPAPKVIRQVVEVLRNGGLVIYPTETSYGIGCDPFNETAVNKINQIKNQDNNTKCYVTTGTPTGKNIANKK